MFNEQCSCLLFMVIKFLNKCTKGICTLVWLPGRGGVERKDSCTLRRQEEFPEGSTTGILTSILSVIIDVKFSKGVDFDFEYSAVAAHAVVLLGEDERLRHMR